MNLGAAGSRRARPSTGTLLAIATAAAITAFVAFGAAHDGATSTASLHAKAEVAAAVGGVLMLLVLRCSALVGPIVFSAADLQWVLTSPAPHAPIVRARLRRQSLACSLAGAIVGGLALISFAPQDRPSAGVLIVGTTVTTALAAATLPYVGWLVQSSRRASRVVTPSLLAAIAAAWVLAAATVTASVPQAVVDLVPGPLAWPFVALAAGPIAVGAAALGTLGALLLAARLARARAGSMSLEALEARATTRNVLSGSLLTLDWRALLLSVQPAVPRWAMRHPARRPSGRRTATLWLTVALLLRAPERLLIAAALTIAAGAWSTAGAVHDDGTIAIGAAAVLYLAATLLAEPLRVTYDSAGRTEGLLGRPVGSVALAQTLLIAGAVAALGILGAAIGAAATAHLRVLPALLIALPAAALAAATGAASSARAGGRIQLDVLVGVLFLDENVSLVFLALWLVRWPLLTVTGGFVALGAAFDSTAPHGALATVPLAAIGAVVLCLPFLARVAGWATVRAAWAARSAPGAAVGTAGTG